MTVRPAILIGFIFASAWGAEVEVPAVTVVNEGRAATQLPQGEFLVNGTNRYTAFPRPIATMPPRTTLETSGGMRSPTFAVPGITTDVPDTFFPDRRLRPLRNLRLDSDHQRITEFPAEVRVRCFGEDELGGIHDLTDSEEIAWSFSAVSPSDVIGNGHARIATLFNGATVVVSCYFRGSTLSAAIPVDLSPPDTDGDGMPDAWELLYGLNPLDPTDALSDLDSDGLSNLQEWVRGTNPLRADTDGDGLEDGIDDDPLVPERIQPTLAWLRPAPQDQLEAGGVLTVSVDARDNARVARVEVELVGSWRELTEMDDQTWSGALTLPQLPGRYVLRVRAFDLAGNREQISQILDLSDHTPPTLTWESPVSGNTFFTGQSVEVRAQATDASGIRRMVMYDDGTGLAIAESQNGALQAMVTVPAGPAWHLRAVAEDTMGNMTTQTREFSIPIDGDPPHIQAILPPEGTLVSANTPFAVTVTAVDVGTGVATLEVLVGAASTGVQPFGDGSALVTAPNAPGPFVLTVRVADRAGNVASAQRTLEASDAERDPPVLVIVSPAPDSTWLHHQDIPVVVEATDASAMAGVTIAVDGVMVRTLLEQPFAAQIRAPAMGSTMRVSVEASDVHGNTAQHDRDIALIADVVPPLLRLDPPDASRFAPGEQITIAVDATDDAGVDAIDLRINGTVVMLDEHGRTTWQAPDEPGDLAVEVAGRDRSGNSAQITAQWTADAGIALWFVGPLEDQPLYAGTELPVEIGYSTAINGSSIRLVLNGESPNSYSYSAPIGRNRYFGLVTPSVDHMHIIASAKTIDGREVMVQRVIPVLPWPQPLLVTGHVRDPRGNAIVGVEVWSPGADRVRSGADGNYALLISQAARLSRTNVNDSYGGVLPVYAWSTQRGAVSSGAAGFLPTNGEIEQGVLDEGRFPQGVQLICWPHPGADLGQPVVDASQPLGLAHPWEVDGGLWMQVWADPRGRILSDGSAEGVPGDEDTAEGRAKALVSFLDNWSSGPTLAAQYAPLDLMAQVYWFADDRGSVATWASRNSENGVTNVTRVRFQPDGSADIIYPNTMRMADAGATVAFGTQRPGQSWNGVAVSGVRYDDRDVTESGSGEMKIWSTPVPEMEEWELDGQHYLISFQLPLRKGVRQHNQNGMSFISRYQSWGPFIINNATLHLPIDLIEEGADFWETEENVRSYFLIHSDSFPAPDITELLGARGAVLNAMGVAPIDVQETRVRAPIRVTGRVLEGNTPVPGAAIALGRLSGVTDAEGRFTINYDRPALSPTTSRWYVDHAAALAGDGQTWATAFTTIEEAAFYAKYGDEVWVATGTYRPRHPISGDPRRASFMLPGFTRWHGGFISGAASADEADPWRYPSILSGDIGVPGDATDNAYRVVTGGSIYLDGFVVRGGRGNANGAGLQASSAIITRCWFDDNQTLSGRGGGLNSTFSLTCFASVFTGNSAPHGGAVGSSAPNLESCVFLYNYASQSGGAIQTGNGPVHLTRLTFHGNHAASGPSLFASTRQYAITCQGSIFDDVPHAVVGLDPQLDVMRESFWREHSWGTAMLASKPNFQAFDNPQGPDGFWGTEDDGFQLADGSVGIDAVGPLQHWNASYTDLRGLLPAGSAMDAGAYERDGFVRGQSVGPQPYWESTEPLGEIAPLTVTVDGNEVITIPAVDLHGANIIVLDDIDITQAPPGGLGLLRSNTP